MVNEVDNKGAGERPGEPDASWLAELVLDLDAAPVPVALRDPPPGFFDRVRARAASSLKRGARILVAILAFFAGGLATLVRKRPAAAAVAVTAALLVGPAGPWGESDPVAPARPAQTQTETPTAAQTALPATLLARVSEEGADALVATALAAPPRLAEVADAVAVASLTSATQRDVTRETRRKKTTRRRAKKRSGYLECTAGNDDLLSSEILDSLAANPRRRGKSGLSERDRRRILKTVKGCYQKALERRPGLRGVVEVTRRAGATRRGWLAHSDTIGDGRLLTCIRRRLARLRLSRSVVGSVGMSVILQPSPTGSALGKLGRNEAELPLSGLGPLIDADDAPAKPGITPDLRRRRGSEPVGGRLP